MPDELTFTPATGTAPEPVRLLDFDLGEADIAGIVKKHSGYGPKLLKIGPLDGQTHLFTVSLDDTTKTDVETLLAEWKALKWQPGTVAYELAGAGDTLQNVSLLSALKNEEFPAISSIGQNAQYVVNLVFLETTP